MLCDLVRFSCGLGCVCWSLLRDHDALVAAIGQIIEHLVHLVDERGVTSQVLYLLVGDDEAADSLCEVDKQGRVAYIIFRDLSLIVSKFGEVLSRLGSEHGQANDCVADHDSSVLNQHGVIDAHQEALFENEADV